MSSRLRRLPLASLTSNTRGVLGSPWTVGSTIRNRDQDRVPPNLASRVKIIARRGVTGNTPWLVIGLLVSGISLWQGFGYAVGGNGLSVGTGWRVLIRLLPGGLRTHGVIMAMLGFALAVDLYGGYTKSTKWVLRALRTYCIVVTVCFIASWIEYGVVWGAPGWWMLLAGLTVWMTFFAPDTRGGSHGAP